MSTKIQCLPEPRDDREPFATDNGRDFMHRLGSKSDEQSRLAEERRWPRTIRREIVFVVQIQRAAAVAILLRLGGVIIKKNDHGDAADTQVIELELFGVPVLMPHEKIARLVTQKLWLLAVSQRLAEMLFERGFQGQQTLVNLRDGAVGRMKARGLAHRFVNRFVRTADVYRRACRRRRTRFVDQIAARLRVQKIPGGEDVIPGCGGLEHLLFVFENDSIGKDATIKTGAQQTFNGVLRRLDDRLAHAIERRVQ